MKNKITYILIAFLSLVIGFVIGNYTSTKTSSDEKTDINQLKNELLHGELNQLDSLVVGHAEIERDRNPWTDKVTFTLSGKLYNHAIMAVAKDISVKVDYLSQTKAVISSENLIFYRYINPSDSISIVQEVNPPTNTESINFIITSVKGDSIKDVKKRY